MAANNSIRPQSGQTVDPNSFHYGSINTSHLLQSNMDHTHMDHISHMDQRKLSMSRRFFLLLTVFDVIFTFLLWIIGTVVSTQTSINTAFRNEVLNYEIQTSMFDVVLIAVSRLFLIVLFYVFLKSSHWGTVAVTTVATTVFTISKVFLFQWSKATSTTAAVVLLVCSFVLSWGEAWFLDFRVLPNELKALHFIASDQEDQAPVISHPALSRSQSDDGSAFYSPPVSDGEENDKERDGSTVSEVEWLTPKNSNNLASVKI